MVDVISCLLRPRFGSRFEGLSLVPAQVYRSPRVIRSVASWLLVLSSGSTLTRVSVFISPQDGGKDVFLHITAVQAAGMTTVKDGQKVSYEVVSERGKLAASDLKLA